MDFSPWDRLLIQLHKNRMDTHIRAVRSPDMFRKTSRLRKFRGLLIQTTETIFTSGSVHDIGQKENNMRESNKNNNAYGHGE